MEHSRAKRHTLLHGKTILALANGSTLHQAALGQVGGGRFDRRGGTLATATRVDQKFGPGGGAESELGSTKLRRSLNDGFWIGGHRRGR